MTKTYYAYGMRLRPFGPGCQPKDGFVERWDSPENRYWDVVLYNRKLSSDERFIYSLDLVDIIEKDNGDTFKELQEREIKKFLK